MKQYQSYLTGISGISPWPNLTPGLFLFLSKLMKYCLSWFVLMGKEEFWREIKNIAPGKTSPFEWFYKSYSCLLNTTVILTHTLKARQKQNNNNKLHTMISLSLHLQRHHGSLLSQLHMLQCRREILCGSTSNRHFWTTKTYWHCKLDIKFKLYHGINNPLMQEMTSQMWDAARSLACVSSEGFGTFKSVPD